MKQFRTHKIAIAILIGIMTFYGVKLTHAEEYTTIGEEVYVMTADEILWEDAYMNAEGAVDPYVWEIWDELSDAQRDEITALIDYLANSFYEQNFYDK